MYNNIFPYISFLGYTIWDISTNNGILFLGHSFYNCYKHDLVLQFFNGDPFL